MAIEQAQQVASSLSPSVRVVKMEVHIADKATTPASTRRWRAEYGEPPAPHLIVNFSQRIPKISQGPQPLIDAIRQMSGAQEQPEAHLHVQVVGGASHADEIEVLLSFSAPHVDDAVTAHTYYYSIMLLARP